MNLFIVTCNVNGILTTDYCVALNETDLMGDFQSANIISIEKKDKVNSLTKAALEKLADYAIDPVKEIIAHMEANAAPMNLEYALTQVDKVTLTSDLLLDLVRGMK